MRRRKASGMQWRLAAEAFDGSVKQRELLTPSTVDYGGRYPQTNILVSQNHGVCICRQGLMRVVQAKCRPGDAAAYIILRFMFIRKPKVLILPFCSQAQKRSQAV